MNDLQTHQSSVLLAPASSEMGSQKTRALPSRSLQTHVKPFEFVSTTPCSAKKADTRKAVRAHVMRDYHRNRRIAETKNYATQKHLESAASLGLREESLKDASHMSAIIQEAQAGTYRQFVMRISPRFALSYLDNSKQPVTRPPHSWVLVFRVRSY